MRIDGCVPALRRCGALPPQSQAEKEQLPVRPGTVAKLRSHIDAVILSLPDDLQGILHKPSSP